jgi:AcrR family transcriptional regulator
MRTDSRTRIINVSLELFSEAGYTNTPVREIAREVGMRESSLYNHVKSKEDILVQIIAQYKKYREENNILTDDLLAKLNDPHVFLKQFADKLIREWNSEYEKKIFRLVLMEQFHEIGGEKFSVNSLIGEVRAILVMVFEELSKYKVVKKKDALFLANEFIYPLFFIRLELLTSSANGLPEALERAKKHVDFFWDSIKVL